MAYSTFRIVSKKVLCTIFGREYKITFLYLIFSTKDCAENLLWDDLLAHSSKQIANMNGQLASLMEAMKDMRTNVDSLQKRSRIQGGVINDLREKNDTQDRTINDLRKKNEKQDRIIAKQGSTIDDLRKRNKNKITPSPNKVAPSTSKSLQLPNMVLPSSAWRHKMRHRKALMRTFKRNYSRRKLDGKKMLNVSSRFFHFIVLPLP